MKSTHNTHTKGSNPAKQMDFVVDFVSLCLYNVRPFIKLGLVNVLSNPIINKFNPTTGDWMPAVKLKENEPFDVALRRFKRSCEKAGVLSEVRRREFYEKPTWIRKRKAAAAVKRHAKKVQREQRKMTRLY